MRKGSPQAKIPISPAAQAEGGEGGKKEKKEKKGPTTAEDLDAGLADYWKEVRI